MHAQFLMRLLPQGLNKAEQRTLVVATCAHPVDSYTTMLDSTAAVVRGRDVHRATGLPHVRPPLYLTQGTLFLALSHWCCQH